MRISKSKKQSINAATESTSGPEVITLTRAERKQLIDYLRSELDMLAEYHDDLDPSQFKTLGELLDAYFFWAEEYNDGFLPDQMNPSTLEFEPQDKLDEFIIQEYKHYR